jgi:5-methyltetrahydrofolate--homocysteine methyltransferase
MNLADTLSRIRYLVSDGAMGTELAKKGLLPGECPELMNVEHPDKVAEVSLAYVDAGSDIILTNTFGASPIKLARYGIECRTEELNERGAAIAVEAAHGKASVFGSVGPVGEFLEPLGPLTESALIDSLGVQIRALARGGAEGIVLETMTDLGEIICGLRAVREHSDLPVICSMTFDRGVRGYATMMGITPERAAEELDAAGADAVGSNCGGHITDIIGVSRIMREHTKLPLWMKPNAGMPELRDGRTIYSQSPPDFAALISDLLDAGATIVGGCCGTTPEHIRRIRRAVDYYRG